MRRGRAFTVALLTACAALAASAGGGGSGASRAGEDEPAGRRATAARSGGSAASAVGGGSFVLRAGTVYPMTAAQAGPIYDGVVVVRDGRIEAVGRDIEPPADLPVVHYPDASVCPGFVAAASYITPRHTGEHAVSGAYRAVDALDRYAENRRALSWGITTAHASPGGHRLVSGVGAVVKLAGDPDERVLSAEADLSINLGQFDQPPLIDQPFYASSDVAIEPARMQRPQSRMGQLLELSQRIGAGAAGIRAWDYHGAQFLERWSQGLALRIQARRAVDLDAALRFVQQHDRQAYIVGATEGDLLVDALLSAGVPVVLRIEETYDRPTYRLGDSPSALAPRLETAGRLGRAPQLALAGRDGEAADLRMVALMAMRGGLSKQRALEAITRGPAEILGVADRVGSLAPGRDADLLVLSGLPLEPTTHVLRTYVNGRVVFEAPGSDALVVRAGTIWVGNGQVVRDGSVLIEGGQVQAVGQRVPHPPYARTIDAGPQGFVTPGFIDAHGHLGLEGERSRVDSDFGIHRVLGEASREFLHVARQGVTTVMLSAYEAGASGARVAAIKTYGGGREELLADEVAGLKFSIAGDDPLGVKAKLKAQLEKGKKYVEQWKKYEEELNKWQEAQAQGKQVQPRPAETVTETETAIDPITGTWEYTISGDPLPEPTTAEMQLRLTGTQIEGRMSDPSGGGEDASLRGELSGEQVRMEIEEETPFGNPVIECTLDREDHMEGQVAIGDVLSLDFEATRTDKSPVEFKVRRKRRRGEDGRPLPPKVDPGLEPYRELLAGEIPAVVEARTAAEIVAALEFFVDEHKLPLVLLGAEQAADVADEIQKRKEQVGVIAGPRLVQRRDGRIYAQAVDLSRRGVAVALQSDAEDQARNLPLMGLFAVQQGMGGDAALRALTVDAAKMYKLDDRLGTLEPGKDGDILIHTGYPFDAGSQLQRVIVRGNEVPSDEQ